MNVPKLRFKEFDGEWEEVMLCKVSDVRDGTHDSPKYVSMGYPLITSKNLNKDGTLNFENVNYINEEDFHKINQRSKVDNNDILFGMIGTIGNPVKVKKPEFAIKNVALIKEKNMSNDYLIHYLKSTNIAKQFYSENKGGTQKFIALNNIRNLKINKPKDIFEVKQIAAFFDALTKKIQLQQQKIDLLQEQKKGYMQKIFNQKMLLNEKANWTLMSIKDLAKVKTGKAFSSKDFVEDGKYLVVTNKNIQDQEKGIVSTGDRINIEDGKILKDYILNGENILVTMDGVNIGKVGKYSHPKALIAQRVGRLISEEIDFVYQVTKDERFITEMNKLSVGNAIKHISLQQIANYQFMAPFEKEERQKIGHFLSNLDKKITLLNNQLVFLKKQKQGFMQQMFI